ncbi:fumarate hydratase [Paenibacillus darwinianus]|uniref:Fumarate hydratase class I n=1 Tax=Paenibacillus darwinianus TaxID=1380763 RepID=A0A9W5S0Z0_9BACL|nr:FumA C-terminus/TtdB family hydratase beta subunit [Paenibacillus darwinianus]EXX86596.1 fumarate hydratase [Paenibacillus darwinianus]EXX87316.1 fumarate hydratase [Paenibacillus darwinianus]EXX87326.1 fumarate hydratase [Paenibacillus darwinianus]
MHKFEESVYQLVVETSTNLPGDVRQAIKAAQEAEDSATRAGLSLSTIANNIEMAECNVSPICQDTGMPTFIVHTPVDANQLVMKQHIRNAIARATKDGKLRTNSVDSLTGGNTGDNLGPGTPVIHFEQWEKNDVDVRLILKGGGCENKNIQYSLPAELEGVGKAGRDLDGIRKCIMHAVYQAQGQGCSAGFIGVGIGGDRTTGYELAKQQLFRRVDDTNPIPELQQLEEYVMENANKLGIGTMGFGGAVTLLGCKVGVMNRLPASFFVSVAYNCWAYRRQGVLLNAATGEIKEWLYPEGQQVPMKATAEETAAQAAAGAERREVRLKTPFTEEQVRSLHVGDIVIIDGEMHTGRDALHKHLIDHESPVDLNGAVIYHCGPVMLKDEQGWHVKAAGPTTSIREEPYQGDIIKKFGIRAVIGKGGMGAKTLAALSEHGAVYLNAIGGAAQYYAECFKRVNGVDFMEFGIPEAMWHLQTEGFAAIVTMDAHGNSLHADVERDSLAKLGQFKEPVFK